MQKNTIGNGSVHQEDRSSSAPNPANQRKRSAAESQDRGERGNVCFPEKPLSISSQKAIASGREPESARGRMKGKTIIRLTRRPRLLPSERKKNRIPPSAARKKEGRSP